VSVIDTLNNASAAEHAANRRRWIALVVVCFAQLMIVLDTTIVNIALRPIQHELHFTQSNLTWVIDAYLITFGSTLLLAGRLGDLIGRRRIFLAGIAVFTLASLACGLADTQGLLIAGRFIQGIGAGMASSVILAIIVTEFPSGHEQARAMGVFTFVAISGGSIGLLVGGVITEAISWHWIFFINIPIGVATLLLGHARIDESEALGIKQGVDYVGAVLVTLGTMVGVYAIVEATKDGWGSSTTLGFGALSIAMLASFLVYEGRIAHPLMPLRVLRLRGLIGSSAARGLLITGMFSVFFLFTLYLENVRGYSATRTGLAFMPMMVIVGGMSLKGTPDLVSHFGPLRVLICGLSLDAAGLLILATVGVHTPYVPVVLIGFVLLAIGQGTSFMPLLTIAMNGVPKSEAGLASGIVNVSQQLAGALGLAVLTTLSTNHSKALERAGHSTAEALVGGYRLAYLIGAACIAVALVVTLTVLRPIAPPAAGTRARLEAAADPERDAEADPQFV
jgi:EmrB/QacA subfamily drug resistance transporter